MNTLTSNINVGFHLPYSENIIQVCLKIGIKSFQFFLGPRLSRRRSVFPNPQEARKLIVNGGINVFIHSFLTMNLCGSTKSLGWKDDEKINDTLYKCIRGIEQELRTIAAIGGKGVVIHPGSYPDTDKGLRAIAQTINHITFCEGSKILIENCAGEGTKLARNFKEIKAIIDQVDKDKRRFIGICIDTAHIHGVGQYDLGTVDGVDQMYKDFVDVFGSFDRLSVIHLNDSKCDLGKKKDRHECLGDGKIWSGKIGALKYLLTKFKNIPFILETPNPFKDLELITDKLLNTSIQFYF